MLFILPKAVGISGPRTQHKRGVVSIRKDACPSSLGRGQTQPSPSELSVAQMQSDSLCLADVTS